MKRSGHVCERENLITQSPFSYRRKWVLEGKPLRYFRYSIPQYPLNHSNIIFKEKKKKESYLFIYGRERKYPVCVFSREEYFKDWNLHPNSLTLISFESLNVDKNFHPLFLLSN